jgi:hypothetical protein
MQIDDMTYFQTLDLERALNNVERCRKSLSRDLDDTCDMLKGSSLISQFEEVLTLLAAMQPSLDSVWDELQQRQEELETEEEELADERVALPA